MYYVTFAYFPPSGVACVPRTPPDSPQMCSALAVANRPAVWCFTYGEMWSSHESFVVDGSSTRSTLQSLQHYELRMYICMPSRSHFHISPRFFAARTIPTNSVLSLLSQISKAIAALYLWCCLENPFLMLRSRQGPKWMLGKRDPGPRQLGPLHFNQ